MAEPHLIRLRGPWDLQPLARFVRDAQNRLAESDANPPPPGRLHMPADWSALLGADYCGRVRHMRRFNLPTGLTGESRVSLVFDGAIDFATATLNGEQLGPIEPPPRGAAFDITALLRARNELIVDIEFGANPDARACAGRCGGLVGEARLEVFATGIKAT